MKARSPLFLALLFAAAAGLRGALPPEHVEFFESKVRPLLAEHCYACHSAAKGKSKGGLQLDTRDALRRGGASGAAIVAGDTTKGLLLEAVRYKNDDLLIDCVPNLFEIGKVWGEVFSGLTGSSLTEALIVD